MTRNPSCSPRRSQDRSRKSRFSRVRAVLAAALLATIPIAIAPTQGGCTAIQLEFDPGDGGDAGSGGDGRAEDDCDGCSGDGSAPDGGGGDGSGGGDDGGGDDGGGDEGGDGGEIGDAFPDGSDDATG